MQANQKIFLTPVEQTAAHAAGAGTVNTVVRSMPASGRDEDWERLEAIIAKVDPRLLCGLPCLHPKLAATEISLLALDALLMAAATAGIKSLSAFHACMRAGFPQRDLPGMLHRLKVNKAHVAASVKDGRIVLGDCQHAVLAPSLYAPIPVSVLAAAPSPLHARALLLAATSSVASGDGEHWSAWVRKYTPGRVRALLGLSSPEIPDDVAGWVGERLPLADVCFETTDTPGELAVYAAPKKPPFPVAEFDADAIRIPFMGKRALTLFRIEDGRVHGYDTTVLPSLAAKAVTWASSALNVRSEFPEYRRVWLAALEAWEVGAETGIDCWPGEKFAMLAEMPATDLFVEFVRALATDAARLHSNPGRFSMCKYAETSIRWWVSPSDGDGLEHRRISRCRAKRAGRPVILGKRGALRIDETGMVLWDGTCQIICREERRSALMLELARWGIRLATIHLRDRGFYEHTGDADVTPATPVDDGVAGAADAVADVVNALPIQPAAQGELRSAAEHLIRSTGRICDPCADGAGLQITAAVARRIHTVPFCRRDFLEKALERAGFELSVLLPQVVTLAWQGSSHKEI